MRKAPNVDVYSVARRLNVGLSIYIHTLCMRAANAMLSLRICADSPEPLLLNNAISNEFPCVGSL